MKSIMKLGMIATVLLVIAACIVLPVSAKNTGNIQGLGNIVLKGNAGNQAVYGSQSGSNNLQVGTNVVYQGNAGNQYLSVKQSGNGNLQVGANVVINGHAGSQTVVATQN